MAAARELCEVDETGERLLTSARRPIVLLPRRLAETAAPDREGGREMWRRVRGRPSPSPRALPWARAVAPGNRQLGIMLPYTPLHQLLLRAVGRPMVLTSGNMSDEPIAYRDGGAYERLGPIADAFLTHDRAIHIRTDDSVTRGFIKKEIVLLRGHGATYLSRCGCRPGSGGRCWPSGPN